MLASELLASTITLGGQGQGAGQGTSQATATGEFGQDTGVATATTDATGRQATAAPGATAEGTATTGTGGTDQGTDTGQGDMNLTIDDVIVDINTAGESGNLLYLVVTSTFAEGERWIPIPVSMLQWDAGTNGLILNADATMLQNAPSFQNGQYPDTATSGWNAEFDTFWQSSGAATGTGGTGTESTPTP
jgi:hypothetical protein